MRGVDDGVGNVGRALLHVQATPRATVLSLCKGHDWQRRRRYDGLRLEAFLSRRRDEDDRDGRTGELLGAAVGAEGDRDL
jgi:hypothetical protein